MNNITSREGGLGKKHIAVPIEVGKNHVALLISCECPPRPPMAEEVLNWVGEMKHHPVVVGQPLSLATPGTVPWAHGLSSRGGRDKGCA